MAQGSQEWPLEWPLEIDCSLPFVESCTAEQGRTCESYRRLHTSTTPDGLEVCGDRRPMATCFEHAHRQGHRNHYVYADETNEQQELPEDIKCMPHTTNDPRIGVDCPAGWEAYQRTGDPRDGWWGCRPDRACRVGSEASCTAEPGRTCESYRRLRTSTTSGGREVCGERRPMATCHNHAPRQGHRPSHYVYADETEQQALPEHIQCKPETPNDTRTGVHCPAGWTAYQPRDGWWGCRPDGDACTSPWVESCTADATRTCASHGREATEILSNGVQTCGESTASRAVDASLAVLTFVCTCTGRSALMRVFGRRTDQRARAKKFLLATTLSMTFLCLGHAASAQASRTDAHVSRVLPWLLAAVSILVWEYMDAMGAPWTLLSDPARC